MTSPKLQPELQRIVEARHHDPFAVLGRHPQDKRMVTVRAHLPYAQEVHIAEGNLPLQRVPNTDHYYAELPDSELKRLGIKPYLPEGVLL